MSRMLIDKSFHVFISDNVIFTLLHVITCVYIMIHYILFSFTTFYTISSYLFTYFVTLCYVMLCYVMLWCGMLCYVMLCYVMRYQVTTAQEAFQLVAKGNKVRAVGSTQCNDVSSRCVGHFIV
jgi:hypothetical protein